VRHIFEKCYEYYINIHNIFIDYTQAFVSVAKDKILDRLKQYEVPPKKIKVINKQYTINNNTINNRIKIKINNNFSE
jgi:hypothetical protein